MPHSIGLLVYGIWDALGESLWRGVHHAARKHNINLLTFEGWVLEDDSHRRSSQNILYDIVSKEIVDGLIVLSGSIGQNIDDDGIKQFLSRYNDLPIISIAADVENIPSIVLNNYDGMRLAVEHLITAHNRKRIVFIRGPVNHHEADERYRAYRDVLKQHDLPVSESLVLKGDFRDISAEQAMEVFLKQGIEFDGLVAANDNMAIGAMRILQVHHIAVPEDVSIAGFDNIPEAQSTVPPLTSVSSSFYNYGSQAVDMLVSEFQGKAAPPLTQVSLDLMIRESCGCLAETVLQAGNIEPTNDDLIDAMAASLNHQAKAKEYVNTVCKAFDTSLQNDDPTYFLRRLAQVLNTTDQLNLWHNALSTMRSHYLQNLDEQSASAAESMWSQGRVLIGNALANAQAILLTQEETQSAMLRETGYELAMCFNREQVAEVASRAMKQLNIKNAYIALFEDSNNTLSLLMGGDRKPYPTTKLLPDGLFPKNRQYSMVINTLYFDNEHLGLAIFEVEPLSGLIYDTLSAQISTAIYGTSLIEQSKRNEHALQLAITHTLSSAEAIQHSSQQSTQLADQVKQSAQTSIDVSRAGLQAIKDSITAMDTIAQQVQRIVKQINDLAEHTQQVNNIILGVKQIADQSKMLALNARIEAARAGKEGRGFTVVAQEMKNLAEQSAEATTQVREILHKIQDTTNVTVQETVEGTTNVDQGVDLVKRAGDTIEELAQVIEVFGQVVQEIETTINSQSQNVTSLVDAIRALNDDANTNR